MPQYPPSPSPSLGEYFSAAQAGYMFHGGNQAVVATALAAGLPTTYTGGLVLYNPTTSTNALLLQRATAAFVVAQTNAAVIGIGVGYSGTAISGTLTAVASQGANSQTAVVAQGLLYSSASITLPSAPYLARILGTVDTGALTTDVGSFTLTQDIQGGIWIPPGGYAVFTSSAAGTASSFFGSFVWVEFP